jgi:hypothetical protein
MPVSKATEKRLQAMAEDLVRVVTEIDPEASGSGVRRLAAILRGYDAATMRERNRERGRLFLVQQGRCAQCFAPLASSTSRVAVTGGRILCSACSKTP